MVAVIVVALLAVLAGVVYGFALGRHKVWPFRLIARQFPRATPAGRHNRPRAQQFDVFRPKVANVMLGDSLTEGALWSEIFPGHSIANRGVGGDTTQRIKDRLANVTVLEPRKVFLLAGINDLAQGVPAQTIIQNVGEIVPALKRAGAEVVLLSTLQCSRDVSSELPDQVIHLNGPLKAIAAHHACPFIDLDAQMSDAKGLRPEYTYDGTHVSAQGYVVWARAIEPYLA